MASLLFQPRGLLFVPGYKTQCNRSRQGQRSQEKEMKTNSFNINYVFLSQLNLHIAFLTPLGRAVFIWQGTTLINNEGQHQIFLCFV